MSGLAWTRLAASLPLVALAVGGLTAPALAGPTSAATPSATATAGPLANPSSPDVDPTTLVALTRPGVSDRQVKSQLKGGAGRLSASAAPSTAAARQSAGSVITVSTTAAGAAATIREMEGSGLYQAVDYQVKRTSLGYTSNPDDPYFQGPYGSKDGAWGLKAYPGAGFQQAWPGLATAEGGSATATVAVIDSGLQSNPDLVGSNVTSAYDYVDDDTDATVPNCARSTYQNPCDEDAFHGTAVAGLIGAATNNGLGVAGAAWDNDVIVYRVGEDGNLYGAAIDAAFQDAITRGVRVINCSYGGTSQDQVERILAEQAAQRGILVVAAAGNEAESGNPIEYPAGYDTVMGIAATAADGSQAVRSDFSNYGSDVAIAAPGENITLLGNGGYLVADGTSFATPMVAAAAALIWRMYPTLTLDQVESALTGGAHDLTSAP
ncbi:MAG: S8 family serine peptidase, partial [Bifidobacteriaceae bacterium]|nr:S8 family serine peptidase [Bifidobacteriaceae bacterium]